VLVRNASITFAGRCRATESTLLFDYSQRNQMQPAKDFLIAVIQPARYGFACVRSLARVFFHFSLLTTDANL